MAWGITYVKQEKFDEVVQWLLAMGLKFNDFSPVMFDIGTALRDDVKKDIDSGGAFFGFPWQPLADGTIERWGDHPLLKNAAAAKANGMLYERIYPFSGPSSAGVWTGDPVAILMEHGRKAGTSKAGGKKNAQKMGEMPNRDFLWISDARQDWAAQQIVDWALGEGKYTKAA